MFWQIFWIFLKINLLSTSGPVSIGLLHAELVGTYVTAAQFIEAVGLTSMLPGSEALKLGLFIGYRLDGWTGALAGGLGTLLPPTVLIFGLALLLRKFRHQAWISRFIDGVTPATAALLFSVAAKMLFGKTHLNPVAWGIALLSGLALQRKVPVPFVLLAAGLAGVWLL